MQLGQTNDAALHDPPAGRVVVDEVGRAVVVVVVVLVVVLGVVVVVVVVVGVVVLGVVVVDVEGVVGAIVVAI